MSLPQHQTQVVSMMRFFFLLFFIIFYSSSSSTVSFDPSLDKPFQTASLDRLKQVPCVTLYHRNGRIGCGSWTRDVSTGILSRFSSSATVNGAVVWVLTQDEFTPSNVQQLVASNSEKMSQGILVLNISSSSSFYDSPAATTPNGANTPSENLPYDNTEWNPYGNALELLDLYGTPIFYVPDPTTSTYLLQVANDQQQQLADAAQNDAKSFVEAELKAYMGGAASSTVTLTSEKCLAWRNSDGSWKPKCLPLGGQSVWASIPSSNQQEEQKIIYIATSMDGSSMFHDLSPAANAAASNVLALLMAAKLVGQVDTSSLKKKIVFAFFQGDSYGFIGSRKFFKDTSSDFYCSSTHSYDASNNKTVYYEPFQDACLNPLYPSLAFHQELSSASVYGLLAVDQVGILSTANTMYVHGHNAPSTSSGNSNAFIGNVLMQLTTSFITSVSEGNANTVPSTPLTSALKLSSSIGGGAVLAGYSSAGFPAESNYRSHLDNANGRISLAAIASAATILARAAVAIAYDDGTEDYATVSQYASSIIPELNSEQDSTFLSLSNCLLVDGSCDFIRQYINVERANDIKRTGYDFSGRNSNIGVPPNYYVGVYEAGRQPLAMIGGMFFGAFDGSTSQRQYGQTKGDAIILSPNALETSIHGLLNDFLGRPTSSSTILKSCTTSDNCKDVTYCSSSAKEYAVCTGGLFCVCARSHYHVAVDEALEVPVNNGTGYFVISEKDEGISALYTEPFWEEISVRVYRNGDSQAAVWTTSFAVIVAIVSYGASLGLKSTLVKQKLY
jgi:nicastrin